MIQKPIDVNINFTEHCGSAGKLGEILAIGHHSC